MTAMERSLVESNEKNNAVYKAILKRMEAVERSLVEYHKNLEHLQKLERQIDHIKEEMEKLILHVSRILPKLDKMAHGMGIGKNK